ncbi:RNA-splicing ligase RtcB [Treponema phagedenis]|uniref:3'-phosphate/5'-hydroxy nucleic acid ligase n=3 Tax=Treponema phagedenis TaxID=162 RepID=A0A0B7GXE5_TREPH|nr:RNA-splicing ligase RtcB [Treponema phagedenis]NVP24105.1 RNA-splicing ligase RtcB [Treponema phagedenis]QEJ96245.1 RNA-splicing ligase RtcB [Treponema phagedenis]QEJ99706.1 RNA-splicing ligase RtcB [Treponema phagedenis]QEK00024.1 RNA-splicing ligase RtcB [Treponema phagedenis]QEK05258.1 RNA-splicing ligase RtcB [Treponema phagedenis]
MKNYKIFAESIEEEAKRQVEELSRQEFAKNSKIRIMPDVHAGKGCVIGTTMTIEDKICPNLVGVDIGCGISVFELGKIEPINFHKLDKVIRENIPSGSAIRKDERISKELKERLSTLTCANKINLEREYFSCGSLGGGNHFIEVNKDEIGNIYLAIHSGSRHLGTAVANYHQRKAIELLTSQNKAHKELIAKLKSERREKDIAAELVALPKQTHIPNELAFLSGEHTKNYLHDMTITQSFASENRKIIGEIILEKMNLEANDSWESIHNYVDIENKILRKGATPAYKGQKVIIPMNMRDGSLLCIGKGNAEWNFSAPHGAGRLMSRSAARSKLSFDTFKKEMSGVFSTSVSVCTLDEAPMAYKPMESILRQIKDTVHVTAIIKPLYNFKAP